GVHEEDVLESMEAGSLYRLSSIDGGRTDVDGTPASTAANLGSSDPDVDNVETRVAVKELLALLPERERQIVYLRFFEGLTESAIAERVGVSQMHVSRLLVKSLEQLSKHGALVAE